jgi:hypothetical protein
MIMLLLFLIVLLLLVILVTKPLRRSSSDHMRNAEPEVPGGGGVGRLARHKVRLRG